MTDASISRRSFLAAAAASATTFVVPSPAHGQGASTGFTGPMDEGGYRPVRLAARAAYPSMSDDARDDLEHRLRCQCGCTLDVYVCRTTDFSCPVSPAMHRDVMALVAGGHGPQAILDAFTEVYGEQVLMAPRKEGFNWAGYVTPFVVLGGGVALIVAVIRKWRAQTPVAASAGAAPFATADELARLEAAVRRDDP
ncbi:MAG: cytochrome c-type biogenesis protein [Gemmatimonadaceae bacterium]